MDMEKVQLVCEKVSALSKAREQVIRLEQELGEMIGDHVIPNGKNNGKEESLQRRLAQVLHSNPNKTFSPREAAIAIGEAPTKVHAAIMYRLAQNKEVRKVAYGTYRARKKPGRQTGNV